MRRGRALLQLCGVQLQGCTQVPHAPLALSTLVDSTASCTTSPTKQEPLHWPQTSRLPLLRSFASSIATSPGHQTAASVLQQVQVLKLREHLDDESERSVHIPYTKFVELAKSIGAALDDKEAEEVAAALHRAGVILRQHDTIYLRPDEIAEMITQLLPGGKEDAQQKLAAIEAELADMDLLHERLDRTANRATSVILMTGCCVLATQLALFIWLTWWELSWDVMEPFGYVISLFYSLVGYMYFLVTRGHVFDLGPFKEKWHSYFKEQQKITEKFDEERYKYLLKLRDRYRRHLAHFAVKE